MMYDSIDDELSPLSPSGDDSPIIRRNKSTKKSSSTTTSTTDSLMINRILILMTLAGLVAVSIYLNSFQNHMTQQITTDEEKIHHLEDTIKMQERIIERFNESITNTDILKKLNALEKEWNDERVDLLAQLQKTRSDVEQQLDSTMLALDETVHQAEKDIQDQVEAVKEDFEQYVLHTEDQFSMENSFMVYQLAGTFTLLSCLISMWHMGSHMRRMNEPEIQRKILAILWMCPIYAVTSWLSLVFHTASGYLAIFKDAYEAYIIYQFLSFCISVLGKGDRNKVIDLLSKQVDHLTPPFRLFPCCCKPHYEDDRALANAILTQCQAFTMQFVFWRPVATVANFLLNKYQYYGPWGADNPHDYRAPQFYVTLIQNLSIFVAFAGLLKFYHAVDKDLEWCRPFAKFLCIKGVVFMTFWQGLALTILAESTDVGGGGDPDEWAESAQNFLICLEMLLFSIAHFYCFPVEEWQPGYLANYKKAKFGETLALNDFFTDLKIVMSSNNTKSKKKHSSKRTESHDGVKGDKTNRNDETDPFQSDSNLTPGTSVENSNEGDEEDPKNALVKAFVDSVREFENDDEVGPETDEVQDAEDRIGAMLDAMLFQSPRNSDLSPGRKEERNEDAFSDVEGVSDVEGEAMADKDEDKGTSETTSLFQSQPSPTLEQALRPSIFTTIAAHIDKEKDKEENEDLLKEGKEEDEEQQLKEHKIDEEWTDI